MNLKDVATAYLYESLDTDIYKKFLKGLKSPEAYNSKPIELYLIKLQISI